MVIGATALFKTAHWMESVNIDPHYVQQIHALASFELIVATVVVGYVALRYLMFYFPARSLAGQAG